MVNIESIIGLHIYHTCSLYLRGMEKYNYNGSVFEYNVLISTCKMVLLPTSRRLLPLLLKVIEQKKGEQECRSNGSSLTTANLL